MSQERSSAIEGMPARARHGQRARTGRPWLLAIVALALLGVGAAGCSASNNSASGVGENSSAQSGSYAKVGDTVTVSNVAATLTSVKTLQGDKSTQPRPGYEYIVTHVKLANNSTSDVNYGPNDFSVQSGKGFSSQSEFNVPTTYTANGLLNSGTLAAGAKTEGDIIFQAPKGDHQAVLLWSPSFGSNTALTGWNLNL